MKVRLIAPPYGNAPEIVPPIGLMSIASYIKHNSQYPFDVEVHDCSGVGDDDCSILDRFVGEGVHVVGIPIYSEYVEVSVKWARYLKQRLPNLVLVAGGPHVSLTWKNFTLRWGNLFDYCISGDGEIPFKELIESLATDGKERISLIRGVAYLSAEGTLVNCENPALQLSSSLWPDPFDAKLTTQAKQSPVFIDPVTGKHKHAVVLVNSRSCPMRCSFCSIITVSQKWIAARVEDVVDWLCGEYRRAPYGHIYFLDANFFVEPARVREIAARISEKLPGVTWSALSTVLMFLKMKKDIPMLMESGMRMVELGIESGSQRQLDIMQKDCKVAKNYEAVKVLQEHGLRIGLDYIMFYPEQTIEDLKDNLEFLVKSGLVTQLDDFDHYFNALTLYPGTPLRSKYSKMFGLQFDPDEVPDPTGLFADEKIANIYQLTCGFRDRHLHWIKKRVTDLRKWSHQVGNDYPEYAQKIRLDLVSLKHLPFKVLWYLTDNPDFGDIDEAVPGLSDIRRNLDRMEEEMEVLKYTSV